MDNRSHRQRGWKMKFLMALMMLDYWLDPVFESPDTCMASLGNYSD